MYAMVAMSILAVLLSIFSASTETVASKAERYQVRITGGLRWEPDPGEKGQAFAAARVAKPISTKLT